MPGVGGVGVLSLSEIQAWDVTHLEDAAKDWTAIAEHWESSFTSIHRASVSPGGTVWEGAAAEAAQERAFADLVKVRGLADVLHECSAIARRGAALLYSAKLSVLDAVEEADNAGYVVGEDLSVTPPRGGLAAQGQAEMYAARIQQRAAQLAVHDKEIAARITSSTAPLRAVTFSETPSTLPNNGVQPTDYNALRPLDPTPWQPPPPGYPQGQPVAPGLPPDGVHPPVEGPVRIGTTTRTQHRTVGGTTSGSTGFRPTGRAQHHPNRATSARRLDLPPGNRSSPDHPLLCRRGRGRCSPADPAQDWNPRWSVLILPTLTCQFSATPTLTLGIMADEYDNRTA